MQYQSGLGDLPRVKPKQNFEWFQDKQSVRLRLEAKGTSSKKIDVEISDLILKVNIQEKKFVKIFDLQHEVDFTSKENIVVYANDFLEITLIKKEDITWTDFVIQDLTKEQIQQRREESFKRKEEHEQKFQIKRQDLKNQYDTHATREQMRQEDTQRNVLKQAKELEKQQAEDLLFSDLEPSTTIKSKDSSKSNSLQDQIKKKEQEVQHVYTRKAFDSNIFSDRDLQEYEQKVKEIEEIIPKPRQVQKKDIVFTEKVYPHLAMRETHLKEAPLPKIKQSQGQVGGDLESKNPLWLKDKGDEFIKNQDYYSALNAYNQALQIDKDQITCLANKSIIHMQLFNYEECVQDCNKIIEWYSAQKDEEKQAKFHKLFIKTQLRKSIALSWKGNLEQAIENLNKLLVQGEDKRNLDEIFEQQIKKTIEIIEQRNESLKQKRIGDSYYMVADYEKALENYKKGLERDQNETILANISITYLKQNKNEECLQYCEECIQRIKNFTSFTNFNSQMQQSSFAAVNGFLIKLFLRKSKAQQNLGQVQEAFETIKKAMQIDDKNKEAKSIFQQLEKQIIKQEVLALKEKANQLMKNKEVTQALELYNECLKKSDQEDTLDYLALILNKCVCFLHLNQYDDIISSTLRGLKIIRSFKNRVISWENLKLSKEDKQKFNDFEVRFLIRRANAYIKLNQFYNSKLDFQEALKLDPNNEQIKKDYEKLQSQIN